MGIIRWIIGGVVGAVVGAAAWIAMEHFAPPQIPTEWGAILVGILGGLGTRNLANADRINFGRGAVAMILTLLFIVGAKYAYAQILIASQGDATAPAEISLRTGDDVQPDDASDGTNVAVVPPPMDEVPVVVMQTPSMTGESIKSSFSPWDMVWFGLSGFIAYQLGKSPRRKPALEEGGSTPTEAPPEEAS